MPARRAASLRRLLATLLFFAATLAPARAHAYAWMIRHEYFGCAMCHADPSGGGLLTAYGRAQSEVLLRTHYKKVPEGQEEDPGTLGNFLFLPVELPSWLLLGGDVRDLGLVTIPDAGKADARVILMQADLAAQVKVWRIRAYGSLGYLHEGGMAASVSRGEGPQNNDRLVSRTYWLGLDLGADDQWTARAGRMNLPYGVRSIEHVLWARRYTRTDVNAAQQHGLALAYNGEKIRGEAMAIFGNFQIRPDDFRDRGGAAFVEWLPHPKVAVGVDALVSHADADVELGTPAWRQAYGLHGRVTPHAKLVLTAEGSMLFQSQLLSPSRSANYFGTVGYLQADVEIVQGLHVGATGELFDRRLGTDKASAGVWGTAWWFFAPHADVRLDVIYRSVGSETGSAGATALLAQLHGML